MTINLNDNVTVSLTEFGKEVLKDYHKNLGSTVSPTQVLSMPLWELAQIFGPHLYNGAPKMVFSENLIEVKNPPMKEVSLSVQQKAEAFDLLLAGSVHGTSLLYERWNELAGLSIEELRKRVVSLAAEEAIKLVTFKTR